MRELPTISRAHLHCPSTRPPAPSHFSAGLKSNLPRKQSHLSKGTGQVMTAGGGGAGGGALKFCFNGRFVVSSVGNSGGRGAHLPTK